MSGDSSSVATSRLRNEPARAVVRHVTAITAAVAASAKLCSGRLLAALHESRRRQAAIEYVRYQHLIFDPTTGICFGGHTTTEAAARSDYPQHASRAAQRPG